MGRIHAGAMEASDAATMARPKQPEHHGRAFFCVRRFTRRFNDAVVQPGIDRLLEVGPFLTTILLVSVYPLLRYLRTDPFPAEVFRYFLMATAQLYIQGKLALGLPISYTPVTRK